LATASTTANVYYLIYVKAPGQSWRELPLPVNCCSFTASGLANGSTYEFKVVATNTAGKSAASSTASARPMPPLPQAPTGLNATAGDGKVTLHWTASSTSNVWYWIDMRAKGGAWQTLKYPVTTCCTFTVGYLFNGTTYEFRVRATNLGR
jgi:Fibronectin type III domain